MEKIKTLANCPDEEALAQMYCIIEDVDKWMKVTDISNLRKRLPKLDPIPEDADEEKKAAIKEKNDKRLIEQGRKNLMDILKAAMKDHPKETARIMRLSCFVDPEDNTHNLLYYMQAFSEMMQNETVVNFFLSLGNLGQSLGLTL